MADTLKTILWLLGLILLPTVLLGSLWFNPLSAGEDDVLYYYPLRVEVGKALARGDWPITDPLTAGGMAVLGDPQAAVFFPTTWLFTFLPAKLAYSLSIFVAFATAGVGMWVYLRRLGLVRPAAGFGAIAFLLGGFFVGHRVHLALIQTAAFFPWGLWCFELLRNDNSAFTKESSTFPSRLAAFAAMVPVFSLTLLAGHWPTVIQMSLVWFVYVLFRVRPLGKGIMITALAGIVVVGITAPQWTATFDMIRQATRAKLSYVSAGENSYLPISVILWCFPFFYGSRWPNLYPQHWWGPWHLCETLGYVGLVTLVLAIATAWKFRKWKKSTHKLEDSLEGATKMHSTLQTPYLALVRAWSWICIGAGVFMLGYYLPTYWLIYKLPVLGMVRCPSRMILALGCGLVTLAAIGIHTLIIGQGPAKELSFSVQRACRRKLPMIMIASLVILTVMAILLGRIWPGRYPFPMNGSWQDAIQAAMPYNPAIWIPLVLVILTSVAVWYWLRRPAKNWPVLIALLIVDLATVAPFVDASGTNKPGPSDPDISPAAAWLREHAPKDKPYRVWGLGNPYGRRQAELLLPRTNVVQNVPSISTYGPFQTSAHVDVLGFKIYGTNTYWQELLRCPDLLKAYNVRYILMEADSEYERFLPFKGDQQPKYQLVASLPAVFEGDPNIHIYEHQYKTATVSAGQSQPVKVVPEIGFASSARGPGWWLWRGTFPAACVYGLVLAGGIMVRLGRKFRKT